MALNRYSIPNTPKSVDTGNEKIQLFPDATIVAGVGVPPISITRYSTVAPVTVDSTSEYVTLKVNALPVEIEATVLLEARTGGVVSMIKVNPVFVAMPPGVVTVTAPDAPDATTAVMLVAETTLNDAATTPPILTAVAPIKFVPVIVIVAPAITPLGVKDIIVGAAIKTNPALVAMPPGVVTVTVPEVPAATTAVMLVAETTLNDAAAAPPKLTAVAPVKFVPIIVIVAPVPPLSVNDEIVGARTKINPAFVAVPPGVVTDTLPEVPVATTAVILVAEPTAKEVAEVPPKLTAVAPVKSVPVIVMVDPVPPMGVNDEIVGGRTKVNPAFVAVPPGVVTDTLPEVPDATTAVMLVIDTTLNEVAAVPPKLTAVAPVKSVPVIVIVDPTPPAGVKDRIVGAGINVNPDFVAVPSGVVMETLPEAPEETTAVMLVAETTLNEVAAVPPKLTVVAPVKFIPSMVMLEPEAALVGINDEIVGTRINVKPDFVAVPPGVVTDTLPEAPAATTAVMLVADTTLNDEAFVPPKLTAVAPVNSVPDIVIVLPTPPLGVNDEIVGKGTMVIVKLVVLVAV